MVCKAGYTCSYSCNFNLSIVKRKPEKKISLVRYSKPLAIRSDQTKTNHRRLSDRLIVHANLAYQWSAF